MITRILGRAVAATATAALLLAPMGLISAPQFATVACSDPNYTPSEPSSTSLVLRKSIGQYGSRNSATATVESNSGNPTGEVVFTIGKRSYTRPLEGGIAKLDFPRRLLSKKTHTVKASYDGDCTFVASASSNKFYTVVKARVRPMPKVVDGRLAKFSATFRGGGGLEPRQGNATFTVQKMKGSKVAKKAVTKKTVKIDKRGARTNLKDLKKGKYRLTVKFLGNRHFKQGSRSVVFIVNTRKK